MTCMYVQSVYFNIDSLLSCLLCVDTLVHLFFYAGMGHRSVFSGLRTKKKRRKCQVQGLDWKIFDRFSESLENYCSRVSMVYWRQNFKKKGVSLDFCIVL